MLFSPILEAMQPLEAIVAVLHSFQMPTHASTWFLVLSNVWSNFMAYLVTHIVAVLLTQMSALLLQVKTRRDLIKEGVLSDFRSKGGVNVETDARSRCDRWGIEVSTVLHTSLYCTVRSFVLIPHISCVHC